jgi:nucleoid-associated protein YgaU
MDSRRLTGLIALIVLLSGLAVLIYYDVSLRPPQSLAPVATTTEPAAAPAEKPIEIPALAPQAPAGSAETPAAATPPPAAETPAPAESAAPPPAASATEAPKPEAPAATEPPPASEAAKTETPPSTETPAAPTPAPATESGAATPQPEAPAVEAGGATVIAETEAPPAEPPKAGGEAATPAAPAPSSAPGVVPSFDVVRVEPSGETVIAGLAEPNATIDLLDGAAPLATAKANERGEWAIALEAPLPAGTHDLSIRTTSEDKSTVTLSDQRLAVEIAENKTEQPLVVLNTPGTASKILEVPKAGEGAVAEQPAASGTPGEKAAGVAPAAPNEGTEAPATSTNPPTAEAKPAEPAAAPAETVVASAPVEPAAGATGTASSETPAAAAPSTPAAATPAAGEGAAPPAAETPTASKPAAETPTAAPKPPAVETAAAEAPKEAPTPAAAGEPAPASAAAEQPTPAEEKPAPPPVVPEVGVAAVEADTNGALYVAGTATTLDPVRVYLDDQPLGEAKPSSAGTWLLQVKRDLPPGRYSVRVDQVDETSGNVLARAEVPFEREIEVAALKPIGQAGGPGGSAVSGTVPDPATVIIRRGDNLWRISRRVYGRGIRYSTIYRANRDQIRNPRWVYPGQVFVVPAGDVKW